jgi:hypothetical protein
MGSIGKLAWFSLASSWLATAAATAILAAAPSEVPSVVRVSSTRGPVTHEALVTFPVRAAR